MSRRPDVHDEQGLRASVDDVLGRWPSVGCAIGVVRDGRLAFFHGHGAADIPSARPVTADTVFRIASITKTFTAVAVMQLWERGLVDLDAPANDYLRAYQLRPADPAWRPATVRHLLTHTAGIGEVAHPTGVLRPDFGESVDAGQPLPSLAEFYGGEIRLHAEPGSRFVYNNHGPATLGQLVEDVTGSPLDRYLQAHVFGPLGMTSSDLQRSARVAARLATGYEIRARGVERIDERDMVTAGAASIYSSPRDMARYVAALLGAHRDGAVLAPGTVATMFEPHHQPDPRVPGMGLGFFRSSVDGRDVVGHQGTHPGFHSQVLLAPAHGVGVMLFTNGARNADFWLPSAATRLLRDLLPTPDRHAGPVPHRPAVWRHIRGRYRVPAQLTDVRLRAMIGAGAHVFVRDGRPMLRFLTPVPALARGFPLHPDDVDDPYVFRIEPLAPDLNPMRVVFDPGTRRSAARLYFDVMPLALVGRRAR
jgi:CubicO group peptidase (beta-lactamase class C family)